MHRTRDRASSVYNPTNQRAVTIGVVIAAKTGERILGYYNRHIFFCCNQREIGAQCCNNSGSQAMREYAKDRVKQLKLHGPGKVRVNQSGCLDRCERGPVIVVYPEAIWYTYIDREDIDEIIREHLQHGRIVERLRI